MDAKALLRRHLSPEQLRYYDRKGGFYVTARSGRRYWLCHRSPNVPWGVYQVDRHNRPRKWFGFYTFNFYGRYLPEGDHLLVKKLLLENDERKFRKIACNHTMHVPRRTLREWIKDIFS